MNRDYSYRAPPIVEAILELRLAAPASDARLKKAADWLRGRYKNEQVEQVNQANINFVAQQVSFADEGKLYKLSSADLTQLCTLSRVSFAWVNRAPYVGWSAFSERFSKELPTVIKALENFPLVRIGLRYVNRIDVKIAPDGLVYHEDYLNFKISAGPLLEPTNGYLWQLTKHFPDVGLKANVQSAVVEPEMPQINSFTFDIDVFRDENVPQRLDDILSVISDMRNLKNRIFESGITDKAREQYS